MKRASGRPFPRIYATLAERIQANISVSPTGCWIWLRHIDPGGYASIGVPRDGKLRTTIAHRVSYETFVGPIPDGLQLDHLCRVRHCVNPAHLEPVTARENSLRGLTIPAENARKTHCDSGHPFDQANTHIGPTGHRRCRSCDAARARRRNALKRRAS